MRRRRAPDLGDRRRDARPAHRHDVLGRRQPGATVRSAGSREAARRFAGEHASDVREQPGPAARSAGTVELFDTLEPAVATAWLIIEAVSEDLALKKQVFRELGRLAGSDAILATNSSSYPSSRLLDAAESPERLLNVHFQMPPELIAVEG